MQLQQHSPALPCLAQNQLQLMHGNGSAPPISTPGQTLSLTPLILSSRTKPLPHHLPTYLPHTPFSSPIIHPNPNTSLLLLRTTLCILQSCSRGRNSPYNDPRSGQEHPPTHYLLFTNTPSNPLPWMKPVCRCHSNTFKKAS